MNKRRDYFDRKKFTENEGRFFCKHMGYEFVRISLDDVFICYDNEGMEHLYFKVHSNSRIERLDGNCARIGLHKMVSYVNKIEEDYRKATDRGTYTEEEMFKVSRILDDILYDAFEQMQNEPNVMPYDKETYCVYTENHIRWMVWKELNK